MTQPPVTVTYTLEEVLGQLHQKLDRIDTKVDDLRKEVDTQFDHLQADIVEIKMGQIRMEGDMKTLESQFKGDMNTQGKLT